MSQANPSRWQATPLSAKLGIVLTALSFFLLVPGVMQPIMTLSAKLNMFGLSTTLFEETRSIWQTVTSLADAGYPEVGFMVLTFSVIIPVVKGLWVIGTWFYPSPRRWQFIAMLSKWSMADVFVVAMMVSFFTAKATADLQAGLHSGFYWFSGYCIVSIISGQLLAHSHPPCPGGCRI